MEKCKEIGIHLTHSEYYGATDDSRGITDIYCNIEQPQKKVHKINASCVGFEDKVEACLKCPNLDEEVRSRILCKNPYGDTHIINKTSYSHWALQCNYSDYVANEEKPTKLGKIIFNKRYNCPGDKTYKKFLTEVCDECYLNPKNYKKN